MPKCEGWATGRNAEPSGSAAWRTVAVSLTAKLQVSGSSKPSAICDVVILDPHHNDLKSVINAE
jgi:hypothetical protein